MGTQEDEGGVSSLQEALLTLDQDASVLSTIAVAVAALSCEASEAGLQSFDLTDSGDGSLAKEDVGVASDIKTMVNGSKLVVYAKGSKKPELESITKIPVIIGNFREAVKNLHSVIRVVLNAGKKVGGKALLLGFELRKLGESSWDRARSNLDSANWSDEKGMFEKDCPSGESLRNGVKLAMEADLDEDYVRLLGEVNVVLKIVWKIVAWEAVTAFVALEGVEWLNEKDAEVVESDGGDVKSEKKEKKKKKKVVLGKGTGVLVEMIKDWLMAKRAGAQDNSGLLESLAEDLPLLLDPKGSEFDKLLQKVKDILESNESRRIPKTPKGTRDFAKEQMVVRKKAFSTITNIFEKHCATALDTPAFELRETLMGKYGEDSKLVYDLADQGGELCCLRYDLTVPFARYVAMNGLSSFKRYHIDKVWRRDNPSKGRYREFYQSSVNPVKLCTSLSLMDSFPQNFLEQAPFKHILNVFTYIRVEQKGLSVETADKIGTFVKIRGPPLELLSKLTEQEGNEASELLKHDASKEALSDLMILFDALKTSRCINKVVFDLSLARGLDYYTGVVFEASFKGGVQVGSIGAGGRYDNLVGIFGNKQVPAVGMSLGIERVLTIMEEKAQIDKSQTTQSTETQVLVAVLDLELSVAAELVSKLWDANIKAEFKIHKRVAKHIEYAKESKIPWMVLVGERELNEGIVKLKNFQTGGFNEEVIPTSKVAEELLSRLNSSK
ncbi:hypothetical protein SLEP1_g47823 [Rubroshorea leprosula]|uniref:histidine--tRNA ligase n=1 Tax=Rubroshorea leprosula TaxID=152421 RepID=A0AAV5LRX8_9ROSI|nr:hypothetical protein SLEP1_g47823 [Rubroshorea leprosula]